MDNQHFISQLMSYDAIFVLDILLLNIFIANANIYFSVADPGIDSRVGGGGEGWERQFFTRI